MSAWSARARRAHRLVRRVTVDGGLPPPVRRLYADVARLRVRDVGGGLTARLLPARGRRGGRSVREGWRRWAVAGALDRPARQLAHLHATTVIGHLQDAGLHPFLVADGPGLVIGLEVGERAAAWAALAPRRATPGWYTELERSGRRRAVGRRVDPMATWRARRATAWHVYSQNQAAESAVTGRDAAVTVTFWEQGDRDRLERVGVRGLERFASSSPWTLERLDGHPYPGRAALTVAREIDRFDAPVDIVVAWVDGADPEWQASFARWAADHGLAVADPSAAAAAARYRSRDELRYALRSIWLHAGWFRRIHLVTAGHVPPWLDDHPRVSVVHHDDIFPAGWLPVFNSHAIEARLHHIADLAEHIVYFNDDFFLGRPVAPTAFFTGNGLPRVLVSGARVDVAGVDDPAALAVDTAAVRGRELIESCFGKVPGYKLHHAPYALRTSVLHDLDRMFPAEMERTARSRFRHPTDLSVASSFASHVALATGRAVTGTLAVDYVHLESGRLGLHLERLRRGRGFDAFCLNETEQPTPDPAAVDATVASFLAAYFSVPAPWER